MLSFLVIKESVLCEHMKIKKKKRWNVVVELEPYQLSKYD